MIYAYDLPITPVRANVLRRVQSSDVANLKYPASGAERVWAWDPESKKLQTFLKPNSFTERYHENFVREFGDRSDEDQWEIVSRGDFKLKFFRKFTDDPKLFDNLKWVDLTT